MSVSVSVGIHINYKGIRGITWKQSRARHADDHSTAREDESERRGKRGRDGNLVMQGRINIG